MSHYRRKYFSEVNSLLLCEAHCHQSSLKSSRFSSKYTIFNLEYLFTAYCFPLSWFFNQFSGLVFYQGCHLFIHCFFPFQLVFACDSFLISSRFIIIQLLSSIQSICNQTSHCISFRWSYCPSLSVFCQLIGVLFTFY